MDNASDKKPLLSSNSSRGIPSLIPPLIYTMSSQLFVTNRPSDQSSGSAEGSASKKDSKETKSESKKETNNESKKESMKTVPTASGGPPNEGSSAPNRIVRPTVQARPFSTKTKKVYWVFTIIHLILLLAVLFGISYGLLQFVFAQTKNGPLYWGTGSFIGGVPSIMFEPTAKGNKKREIHFNPDSSNSYKEHVERLKKVMKRDAVNDEQNTRCDNKPENNVWIGTKTKNFCIQKENTTLPIVNNTVDKVCSLSSDHMGYNEATPCLLIRLTKVLGFFPMSDEQDEENRPSDTVDSCSQKIKFKCTATTVGEKEGVDKKKIETTNNITMLKGYTPPYIMIRPEHRLPNGKTVINCVPALRSLKKLSTERENKIDISFIVDTTKKQNVTKA